MSVVALLKKVDYLSCLDDTSLEELAARARVAKYASGERIVCELDAGADVFVVTSGKAEISVEPRAGEKQVLGTIEPGGAFGEMSSLSAELRSATVTAQGQVEVLVIPDAEFDALRARRPEVGVALVRVLAARLAAVEESIDKLLAPGEARTSQVAVGQAKRRGSIVRVWRELVVNRQKDLTFLALVSFVLTLLAVRGVVYAAFTFQFAPQAVLRTAYMTGFGLLGVSACSALLTFRPGLRRLVALAYGIGCALIFNELGVTLAFDIFFKDIHTPDPNVAFDVERLYRRTESLRAIAIGLVVLVQATYLRGFYRRAWFIAKTRLRKVVGLGR